MIATSLADEGLDIPTLDAALLAGGGASATRVHQRIGRTLRIDRNSANPRDRSVVIFYDHDLKYFDKHTRKALKIIKTEKRFNVVHCHGKDFIKSEIDKVFGFKSSGNEDIFNN